MAEMNIPVPDTLLLFCVDDDKVVGGLDYENCKKERHELRSFYKAQLVWSLAASGGSSAAP
jgi:hypothetical protein